MIQDYFNLFCSTWTELIGRFFMDLNRLSQLGQMPKEVHLPGLIKI